MPIKNECHQLNLNPKGCTKTYTVVHELLHALGFAHEQSRKDRDRFVEIHFDNIAKGKKRTFYIYLLFLVKIIRYAMSKNKLLKNSHYQNDLLEMNVNLIF